MDYNKVGAALYGKNKIKQLYEKYNCLDEYNDFFGESLVTLYNAVAYFFCTNEEYREITEGKEDTLVRKLNDAIETQIAFTPHRERTSSLLQPHIPTLERLPKNMRLDVVKTLLAEEYDKRFDAIYLSITTNKDK